MSTVAPKHVPNDAPANDGVPTAPTAVPRPVWPFLLAIASIAGLAELAYAIVNVSALPVFLKNGLDLPLLVGYSAMAFLLSEAIFNSPMGTLADKVGRRRLMVMGALTSVVTCLGTAFLRVPENGGAAATWTVIIMLIGLRVLDGAGAAALWPAVFASIGDRVPKARQASAMSVLNIAYMLGLAFSSKIGGFLNDALGARLPITSAARYMPSFFAAAACFALAALLAFFFAPRRAEQHAHHEADPDAAPDPHQATFSLKAIKDALRRVPMLMLLAFVTFVAMGLIAPNVKLFAMQQFKITENQFGNLMLWPALLIAALAIPLGRLGDVWGKARSIHLGMGVCAVALWIILILETEWSVVVLGSLLGVGFLLAFPAYMAFLSDVTGPSERGGVIGAVRMAQGLGAMIGAALASPLFERYGEQTPFLVAGIFLVIAFVLSLLFVREPKKPVVAAAS